MEQQERAIEEMPEPYLKHLRQEVEETKKVLSETENLMVIRKNEADGYYAPVYKFIDNVKETKERVRYETDRALQLIQQETSELECIEAGNNEALREINLSSDVASNRPVPTDDHPIGLALRSIASLFPFVTFALLSFVAEIE